MQEAYSEAMKDAFGVEPAFGLSAEKQAEKDKQRRERTIRLGDELTLGVVKITPVKIELKRVKYTASVLCPRSRIELK